MVLFQLLAVFIAVPALALLPAGLLGWMYWRCRRTATWLAAWAWAGYAVYEQAMQWRILCSGDCNIRIDLLAIYPLLLFLSLVAVVMHLWRRP